MAKARAKASSKSMSKMMDGSLGGFTIIEVVLVLAIAGLIFMMVFIALPNLQRAQRDTQRRNALGEMAAQIQQYQANNNGRLPGYKLGGNKSTYTSQEEDDASTLAEMCTNNADVTGSNAASCFIARYMNSNVDDTAQNTFVDPDGWTYGLTIQKWDGNMPTVNYEDHMIYMFTGAACDGETVMPSNNSRNYALYYKLEGNSSICSQNS